MGNTPNITRLFYFVILMFDGNFMLQITSVVSALIKYNIQLQNKTMTL